MSDYSTNARKVPEKPDGNTPMRDIDQIKALLGFIAFELGIVIGVCWAVVA